MDFDDVGAMATGSRILDLQLRIFDDPNMQRMNIQIGYA